MHELGYSKEIIKELNAVLSKVDDEQVEELVEDILKANKIFVAGSGRSGLSAKAFAMRLGHLGLKVAVVGETVTPDFKDGDLLISCSGSGETKGQLIMVEKAKSLNGIIALLTISNNSSIGKLADSVVVINAPSPKASENYLTSIQPMASLFEQSLLLVLDIVILKLMDRLKISSEEMFKKHVNLE